MRNPGQQWATLFDGRGFTTQLDAGDWTWGLQLVRYGLAGRRRTIACPTRVGAAGARVAYDWDAVLLDIIPEFSLPSPMTTGRSGPLTSTGLGTSGVVVARGAPLDDDLPAWMQDGHFAVQVVMWNPQVYPGLPEQCTAGLYVIVQPDGTLLTEPYGTDVGGLMIWHEIDVDAQGQKVIRFPFSIPGL